MAHAKWYCADCDTHGGGSPEHMSFDRHVEVEHDGGIVRGIRDGDWKDYKERRDG